MTYQMELWVEQRLAELREAGAASRGLPSNPHRWRRSLRVQLGESLIRIGDRLGQPAGAPAIR
jgi:hypothetical protein